MNNVTNGIGYSGEVSVHLTKSNSKTINIHNVGYKSLWDTLAMAVTGYDISSRIPAEFSICSRTGTSIDDYKYDDCLLSHVPFVGAVWGDVVEVKEDSTSARFTATVTKRDRRIKIPSNATAVLRMFDKSGNLLAEVEDTFNKDIAKSHNSMITGVDAIYEWKMIFKNVSASTEEDK